MKKVCKLGIALLASGMLLASCSQADNSSSNDSEASEVVSYHLVSFYVDNSLYKTARVKNGESVDSTLIPNPSKEGYDFIGWTTLDGKSFDLSNEKVTSSLDLYAKFEKKETPTPTPDPVDDLNVDDVKDATKSYYLVIGWYAKTETSGLDDEISKHFYSNVNVFLKTKGATNEQLKLVSFRKFSQDKVADMGAAMNEQGDIDIVVGVGNNINSTAGVSIQEKDGNILMGGKSRYIARLTDNEIAKSLYDFIKTETGMKMFDTTFTLTEGDIPSTPTPEPDPTPDTPSTELNVDDTKDPNKNYYLVIGWYAKTATSGLDDEITKHFYSNVNVFLTAKGATKENLDLVSFRKFSQDKVADMGAAMNEQADLDIVIGVGKNITSSGGVTTLERDDTVEMGDKTRSIARLTDKETATSLYTFMLTENGRKMFDLTYTLTAQDIGE